MSETHGTASFACLANPRPMRDPVSKIKWMEPEKRQLRLSSDLHVHTCMYTFRGGRILEVIDMVINDYDMDEVKRDDSFLYAENCMVMMMLTDEENEEGYIREMYELLNEEKQALYLE